MPIKLRVGLDEFSPKQVIQMLLAVGVIVVMLGGFLFIATHPRTGGPPGFQPGWVCEGPPKAKVCRRVEPSAGKPLS
jgi:hypothetical protein